MAEIPDNRCAVSGMTGLGAWMRFRCLRHRIGWCFLGRAYGYACATHLYDQSPTIVIPAVAQRRAGISPCWGMPRRLCHLQWRRSRITAARFPGWRGWGWDAFRVFVPSHCLVLPGPWLRLRLFHPSIRPESYYRHPGRSAAKSRDLHRWKLHTDGASVALEIPDNCWAVSGMTGSWGVMEAGSVGDWCQVLAIASPWWP